ncbi:MarR family winged helix-turn-helix transcriptional regulator [Micromonospora krabiensis]|uniref:Winged helix DNA-binding domain n=1 Tax=Micromonospora krabiensis TaxID=307121 RepID=A0A1C3MZ73_9ACTN|nr:hypothetical protein [Micromonospora krabiensis]SBV25584.1 Winged helix DNA-binding domain [Micromonospora krabiensis]
MSSSPLTGQVIGRAHYATRALLERQLTSLGLTFPQSIALNTLAAEGGVAGRTHLVARLTDGLKIDAPAAEAVLTDLTDAGLLREETGGLAFTDAGHEVRHAIADATTAISGRLYGDIPAADLAVAGRVLSLVRERADAELAKPTP